MFRRDVFDNKIEERCYFNQKCHFIPFSDINNLTFLSSHILLQRQIGRVFFTLKDPEALGVHLEALGSDEHPGPLLVL